MRRERCEAAQRAAAVEAEAAAAYEEWSQNRDVGQSEYEELRRGNIDRNSGNTDADLGGDQHKKSNARHKRKACRSAPPNEPRADCGAHG